MDDRRLLNIVWRRRRLDAFIEGYFMKEVLLGGLERPVRLMPIEENTGLPELDNLLFVSLSTEEAPYIDEFRARGRRNLGLFHGGDEHGTDDRRFYRAADYVIRHYWFEAALARPSERSLGVIWVPNGYRTGVGPVALRTLLGMADRKIMGFFAGALEGRTLSAERRDMVAAVKEAGLPFHLVETGGFAQGYGPVSYAAYLSNARFALVPGGNSPETVRLYDALETGAIPIVLKQRYLTEPTALGGPPVVTLDSWKDLPNFYAAFAAGEAPAVIARLDAMQRALVEWWAMFKSAQQKKVKTLIEQSFTRSR